MEASKISVSEIRATLAAELWSQRRAMQAIRRNHKGEFDLQREAEKYYRERMAGMMQFLKQLEWYTGLKIVGGKNVN